MTERTTSGAQAGHPTVLDGVRVIDDRPPPVRREAIPGIFEPPEIPLRFARSGPPPRRRAA